MYDGRCNGKYCCIVVWRVGYRPCDVVFMGIDYVSGIIVAGVFHKSRKTENGALESGIGWKGLCRKGMTLLFVLIAYRLDLAIGTTYIRDAVVIGFIANELISIEVLSKKAEVDKLE